MEANPGADRASVIHHLLNTARGRRLAEHLSELNKRKDQPIMNTSKPWSSVTADCWHWRRSAMPTSTRPSSPT
jgi:hypothetical protein